MKFEVIDMEHKVVKITCTTEEFLAGEANEHVKAAIRMVPSRIILNMENLPQAEKTVEQICLNCGKHILVKYHSDWSYEYVGNHCGCYAGFCPVDGEPSITEWIHSLKKKQEEH